jgi:hypothetical protein
VSALGQAEAGNQRQTLPQHLAATQTWQACAENKAGGGTSSWRVGIRPRKAGPRAFFRIRSGRLQAIASKLDELLNALRR